MWRVLLVEDQTIVRQGLKVILEQDQNIKVTHEAENGRQAIEIMENAFNRLHYDGCTYADDEWN